MASRGKENDGIHETFVNLVDTIQNEVASLMA